MIKYIDKIGLGSVQFGISYGISNHTGKTSFVEVEKILKVAYDRGIKIIDTARAYGTSEEIIGQLNNGRFNIISKFMPSQETGDIRFQFQESLKVLKVDNIYGYLAHRPSLLKDYDWDELQDLKKENKIKKIGFSLNEPNEFYPLRESGFKPDIVQVPFSYFDNRFKDLLILLKSEGCEVHTRSTFLQGLFFMNPDDLSPYFNAIKLNINSLQHKYGDNLQTALLDYALRQDFIDKVIIGVENAEQLEKNIANPLIVDCLQDAPNISDDILMPVNWPKT